MVGHGGGDHQEGVGGIACVVLYFSNLGYVLIDNVDK